MAEKSTILENGSSDYKDVKHKCTSKQKKAKDNTLPQPLDGGWGWMCVLGLFIQQAIVAGTGRTFGLIYIELIDRFHQSATATSWVAGIRGSTRQFFSFFSSSLCNRFSVRTLAMIGSIMYASGFIISAYVPRLEYMYVTYGLMLGIGSSLVMAPAQVIVNRYFDKKKARAVGIGGIGGGFGSFILPLLVTFLFNEYGYVHGMVLIGALALNSCVGASLYRPLQMNKPKQKEAEQLKLNSQQEEKTFDIYKEKEPDEQVTFVSDPEDMNIQNVQINKPNSIPLFHLSLLKDIRFLIFSLCQLIAIMGVTNIVFLASRATEIGMDSFYVSIVLSIHGVADMVGKFSFGFILDFKYVRPYRPHVYCFVVMLLGIGMVGIGLADTLPTFLIVVIFRGMCISVIGQRITILSDIIGREKVASALGFACFAEGFGALLGPVIGGFLKDTYGMYRYALFFGGSTTVCAGVMMALLFNINRFTRRLRISEHRKDQLS